MYLDVPNYWNNDVYFGDGFLTYKLQIVLDRVNKPKTRKPLIPQELQTAITRKFNCINICMTLIGRRTDSLKSPILMFEYNGEAQQVFYFVVRAKK